MIGSPGLSHARKRARSASFATVGPCVQTRYMREPMKPAPAPVSTENLVELGRVRDAWAHAIAYYVVRLQAVPSGMVRRYRQVDDAYMLLASRLGFDVSWSDPDAPQTAPTVPLSINARRA